MDNPNFKLKNYHNSVSGNEIALRFAFLDLLQKFKRTEMFCDYYERCRNELVQGYLRLRQERDYYLYLLRNQSESSRSSSSPLREYAAETSAPFKTNSDVTLVKDIDFLPHTEESYEEIEKRLIQQYKEVMEQMEREGAAEEKSEDVEGTYQDTLTESDTKRPDDYDACEQKVNLCHAKPTKFDKSNAKKGIVEVNGEELDDGVNNKMNPTKEIEIPETDDTSPQFQKLLFTVLSDYENISKILLAQNEKLRKLNSRNLRNYLQRQLDPNEKRLGENNPFS